jgi:DNA-binding response OmpR family regulator
MNTAAARVLIAEDDDAGRKFLADNLQADGYAPVIAGDTSAVLELLREPLDALVVDVNGGTLDVIDAIRGEYEAGLDPQLPILALTSNVGDLHVTRLLERGADDVLEKPYSYPELRARLGALLRRARDRRRPRVLRAGSLRVDVRSRRAWVGGIEIEAMRGKEFELLLALIAEPERVFARQELLRSVWGFSSSARTRTLDSHAARLRARLQISGERFVRNVWGVGYRLIDGSSDGIAPSGVAISPPDDRALPGALGSG